MFLQKCILLKNVSFSFPVWIDLNLNVEVGFELIPAPAALFDFLRLTLKALPMPLYVTASFRVIDVAFTTGQKLCLLMFCSLCLIFLDLETVIQKRSLVSDN